MKMPVCNPAFKECKPEWTQLQIPRKKVKASCMVICFVVEVAKY